MLNNLNNELREKCVLVLLVNVGFVLKTGGGESLALWKHVEFFKFYYQYSMKSFSIVCDGGRL